MQHLYPNFYSLVSAPSQPLDPRMRRRSFVWNPATEQTQTGYWLWNTVPEDSTVNPTKFSLPVRRRSVSQTPMRTHSGFSVPETNANPISNYVASSSSSESSATPPPPPAPFADEPRETIETDTEKVISLVEERPVHTSTPIAIRRQMPCEEMKTVNYVATHPTCNAGSLRKNFVITTAYLPTGVSNDYRPTERVRVVPSRYAAAIYPSSRSDFTVNHLPPLQPCFVHPTRMQSAVSLQGLDRACQVPPKHCIGSQQVIRPKLVMGLRDLSSVNRLVPWPNRWGSHVRHLSQTNTQTLTPNWNMCNTFPTINHHSRIHSAPTELPQTYSVQPSSIPSVRRPDPGRRLRMTERRRTLWGTPGATADYIPVVQVGSTFLPMSSNHFDTASSTTTLLCDNSSADDQTTLNKTDLGGLQNVCSDSGVDLAEVDSIDLKQNNINSRTSEITPSSRRRKSFSIRRAQVVSAFEQSLNSMSQRLQMLTHTTAKKDTELHELRATIHTLRSQSGLGLSKMFRTNENNGADRIPGQIECAEVNDVESTTVVSKQSNGELQSQTSSDHSGRPCLPPEGTNQKSAHLGLRTSEAGTNKSGWFRSSIEKAFRKKSPSTSLSSGPGTALSACPPADSSAMSPVHSGICRMTTTSSVSQARENLQLGHRCSQSQPAEFNLQTANRTNSCSGLSPSDSSTSSSSWSASGTGTGAVIGHFAGDKTPHDSPPSCLNGLMELQTPQSNRHPAPRIPSATVDSLLQFSESNTLTHANKDCPMEVTSTLPPAPPLLSSFGHVAQTVAVDNALHSKEHVSQPDSHREHTLEAELARLRQQLNERELKLTDVQLEALASTHQVNQLRDQIARMYTELQHLRSDNERLQQLIINHDASSSAPVMEKQDKTTSQTTIDQVPVSSKEQNNPSNNAIGTESASSTLIKLGSI